jgi:hypothetical protein
LLLIILRGVGENNTILDTNVWEMYITPRIAIDNPTKVENVVLMETLAQNL